MPDVPLLFTPLALRGLALKNRVVVAPMHQYSGRDGHATDWHLMNAGRFAAGGAGLVVVESTKVERRGCGTVGDLGLWDDAFVPGLARIVDLVHECGAACGIQLGHSGRKARVGRPWEGGRPLERASAGVADWDAWELVAPSAIAADDASPVPRALSVAEIGDVIDAWVAATRRADAAGFDMVEIHGAHGFLLHEFLSPQANRRDDAYGGTPGKRMRFALELAEAVRAAWPAGKPLFVRLSIDDDAGWAPADSVALARQLGALGVDVIDCSAGGITPKPVSSAPIGYGYQVPFARAIRREADVRAMAVGLIVHPSQAERVLRDGDADLIALAREMLWNPNWAMDAAAKLGVDPFSLVPPQAGWWLERRAKSMPALVPSTAAGPGGPG
ncbi:MAG: NADH:flavin oxidoreductase/NADH oxidase [Burkholderiaceae bacterium]|jgi:2,4-dienoyl-CoA reductase-like NADH-dependent reductase (Old Yellow Enzyme family)|nr:NADH:flavin oxidoreductase/NADH oxidase [Burkholderiaceae bacterium]